ncbi:hypothetical protein BS17DRAFT_785044 [Gyrodon lividus]|nr:hypothetical protein BS17DRAFT_785044 [Gyrodon lividus]
MNPGRSQECQTAARDTISAADCGRYHRPAGNRLSEGYTSWNSEEIHDHGNGTPGSKGMLLQMLKAGGKSVVALHNTAGALPSHCAMEDHSYINPQCYIKVSSARRGLWMCSGARTTSSASRFASSHSASADDRKNIKHLLQWLLLKMPL